MAAFAPIASLAALSFSPTSLAAPPGVAPVHALAMHGEPKYGPNFAHFEYVNPNATIGGRIRLGVRGTFDTFHPFIPKGNPGAGDATETLLTQSEDEPFTEYGLLAESIEVPDDRSWVAFTLRPEARWHDGRPVSVDDVIWSFTTLTTKGHPSYRFYYASVASAEKIGPRRVRFGFKEKGNRELPLIVGQLPILPKHYWEERAFERTTLEPPLGSGPYRISAFEAGRYIVTERVDDYWGRHLAVNRGRNNFERIRYDYYRDDTVIRQALKAGEIDFRAENQAKAWALDYDVPAVRNGWLNKEAIAHQRPTGMQAFVMNTRRAMFKDRRVRRALAYAFDFEWTNRNLFFGQYTRTESYFSNSELASTGRPDGQELAILEPYRGRISEEVFTTTYRAPATNGSGWPRENLRQAFDLLAQSGWVVRDQRLVHQASGERFAFEILLVSPAFERIMLPFTRNLRRLGIDARVRLVDQSQYINRLRSFDYDMFVGGWGQSESPGNEQRGFWSSRAATSPSARNYAAVSDPVVDELIERLIVAPDRETLVATTRALDRVLLHGHYVIPNWHAATQRILYWDRFSRPDVTTKYGTSVSYWWYDEAKDRRLALTMGDGPDPREQSRPPPGAGAPIAIATAIAIAVTGFILVRRFIKGSRKPPA